MSPLVSIIVLNWNGEKIINECLRSLYKTTYSSYEIIVIDNASSDNSITELEKHGKKILLVKNTNNVGYAKGMNQGIALAKGKYVVTLNNDIVVEPEWLNQSIMLFEKDPKIGSISCRQMDYFQREKIDALFSFMGRRLFLERYGMGNRYHPFPFSYVLVANGASAIYRRKMLTQLGGFNDDYFAYHEDCDLGVRALFNGWKCVFNPNAVAYHRVNYSFGQDITNIKFLHERNRYWFVLDNLPATFIIGKIPRLILLEIRDSLKYLKRVSLFRIYLKARIHVFVYLTSLKWLKNRKRQNFKMHKEYFKILCEKGYIPL